MVKCEFIKTAARRFLPDIFVDLGWTHITDSHGIVHGFADRLQAKWDLGISKGMPGLMKNIKLSIQYFNCVTENETLQK